MRRREFLTSLACGVAAPSFRSEIRLRAGESYFRLGGKPAFLLGRNATGRNPEEFEAPFRWAAEEGDKLVRIHVIDGIQTLGPPGDVEEGWARRWELVFDMAAARGLYVLPVFAVWSHWNRGNKGEAWHFWNRNPYSSQMGGPAREPAELFQDTRCRALWLQWLGRVAARWQTRWNILGWEIFSELDLLEGSSESAALGFQELAAKVLRSADTRRRPITASLAGVREWPSLLASDSLDFIQIHPYWGDLSDLILSTVHQRLRRYRKPVFIGECGLDARPPVNTPAILPPAEWGVRHAIWASAISGAMNGRMLWWEDGYDLYYKLDLHTKYSHAAAPVARFLKDVERDGFEPLETGTGNAIRGGAIGNQRVALGWFRDSQCNWPDWTVRPLEKQSVELALPSGARGKWNVVFHDTLTGDAMGTLRCACEGGRLRIKLPRFEGAIAFAARG
jgi:hypothetical protein